MFIVKIQKMKKNIIFFIKKMFIENLFNDSDFLKTLDFDIDNKNFPSKYDLENI